MVIRKLNQLIFQKKLDNGKIEFDLIKLKLGTKKMTLTSNDLILKIIDIMKIINKMIILILILFHLLIFLIQVLILFNCLVMKVTFQKKKH